MILFINLVLAISAKWTYIKHELSQGQFVNGSGIIQVPIKFPYRQVFMAVDTLEDQMILTVNGIKRKLGHENSDYLTATDQGMQSYFTTSFREFQDHLIIEYRSTSFRNLQIYVEQCDGKYCKSCHNEAQRCDECINDSFEDSCQCKFFIYKQQCVNQCPPQTIVIMNSCHDANLTKVQEFNTETQRQAYNTSQSYTMNISNQSNPSQFQIQFDLNYVGDYHLNIDQFRYGVIFALVDGKRQKTYSYLEGWYLSQSNDNTNRSVHQYINAQNLEKARKLEFKSWGNVSLNWQVSNVSIYHINTLQTCELEHCQSCTQTDECSICQAGFRLYKGNCLIECPITTLFQNNSNTCQDDPLQQVLASLEHPLQDKFEIFGHTYNIPNPKFIDPLGYESQKFLKNINGVPSLVMIDTESTKESLIDQNHYQIRIRFNLILNNQSNFELGLSNKYNFNESQIVDIIEPHTSNDFKLELTCQGSCVVQQYQVILYKCGANCLKCTKDKCLEKVKCNVGSYPSTQFGCQTCDRGCAECTSSSDCLRCKDSIEGRIYCN